MRLILSNLSLTCFKSLSRTASIFGLFAIFLFSYSQDLRAQAQTSSATGSVYPNKTIKFVVPFIPGSLVDVIARSMAEEFQKNWKISVVVENKAGASTLLAAKIRCTERPDRRGDLPRLSSPPSTRYSPRLHSIHSHRISFRRFQGPRPAHLELPTQQICRLPNE